MGGTVAKSQMENEYLTSSRSAKGETEPAQYTYFLKGPGSLLPGVSSRHTLLSSDFCLRSLKSRVRQKTVYWRLGTMPRPSMKHKLSIPEIVREKENSIRLLTCTIFVWRNSHAEAQTLTLNRL